MAIEIDPVCGMSVDTTTSQLSLEHDGTTYWFCGKGCLLDFQDDPEAFLGPDARPSMPPPTAVSGADKSQLSARRDTGRGGLGPGTPWRGRPPDEVRPAAGGGAPCGDLLDTLVSIASPLAFVIAIAVGSDGLKW